jgi:nitrate/TMAO reductase-like tetraheme cytochrome c subunit
LNFLKSNFLKSKKVLVTLAGVAVFLVILTVILGWSSTRFTRISVCQTCHETFVDFDEYQPMGEVSESIEDFRPVEEFKPAAFDVTVGCAECHAFPYEEYRDSAHYDNDLGVRPGCVGCHEPHSVREILAWKFFYLNTGSLGESPFHAISNGLRDIPAWEELRIELAARVRKQMLEEDSAKCRVCHKTEGEWFGDIKRHRIMLEKGNKTCIECHYNLVHEDVEWEKHEDHL